MVLVSIPFNKLPWNIPRLQFHTVVHGNTTMTSGKFSNPGNPDFWNPDLAHIWVFLRLDFDDPKITALSTLEYRETGSKLRSTGYSWRSIYWWLLWLPLRCLSFIQKKTPRCCLVSITIEVSKDDNDVTLYYLTNLIFFHRIICRYV